MSSEVLDLDTIITHHAPLEWESAEQYEQRDDWLPYQLAKRARDAEAKLAAIERECVEVDAEANHYRREGRLGTSIIRQVIATAVTTDERAALGGDS